ncbi:putative serine/threonine-protein kinase [Ananas comosus]|uniref:Putative serine/threonine-protein kinase n=1 Tax=Ananas comosus TaxID=4615 RepID=A0A199VTE0_ANACO|nr:putative serine/threonine-protein kinase [Ananas comosus]
MHHPLPIHAHCQLHRIISVAGAAPDCDLVLPPALAKLHPRGVEGGGGGVADREGGAYVAPGLGHTDKQLPRSRRGDEVRAVKSGDGAWSGARVGPRRAEERAGDTDAGGARHVGDAHRVLPKHDAKSFIDDATMRRRRQLLLLLLLLAYHHFVCSHHRKLRDGQTVAVKCLYENNYKRVEQFMNEIDILSHLRYQNLISLYGCTSCHCHELLLVYEFVPNGTVADHLHGPHVCERVLAWPTRMQIAIKTAEAHGQCR